MGQGPGEEYSVKIDMGKHWWVAIGVETGGADV